LDLLQEADRGRVIVELLFARLDALGLSSAVLPETTDEGGAIGICDAFQQNAAAGAANEIAALRRD
jgi:hypothetical protein